MNITWDPSLSVGVKLIDDQHKHFVEILNQLNLAVEENKIEGEIIHIFTKISMYAEYHFATEEKYFTEFNFEGATEHIEAHNQFKDKIASLRSQANNTVKVTAELVDFLDNWLVNHVQGMDKKYTSCFNSHGLK